MQRKRIFFPLLVGMQTGAATLENSVEVPQKVKNRTTLPIARVGIYAKDTKMLIQKGKCSHKVYRSTVNNSQIMERAQMSIN